MLRKQENNWTLQNFHFEKFMEKPFGQQKNYGVSNG